MNPNLSKPKRFNKLVIKYYLKDDISNKNDKVLKRKKNKLRVEDKENKYDGVASGNKSFKKCKLRQRKDTEVEEDKDGNLQVLHQESPREITKPKEEFKYPNLTTETDCDEHSASHVRKSSFFCLQCSLTFMSNEELKSHNDIHIDDVKDHYCKPCKYYFSEYCDYLIHKTTHRRKEGYKCPNCDYKCIKKDSMQSHIEIHFNKNIKCHICCKIIVSRDHQDHLEEHTRQYLCVECGKNCKTKSYYVYHMYGHTGFRPFQCLYCGRAFFNNNQRKIHTLLHTGEKPYECSQCVKQFTQWNQMEIHMVRYHSVKKHKCTVCDKMFFRKDYLKNVHMKQHTNKFEYKCRFCEKRCIDKARLKRHVLFRHTNERPYKCEQCNTSFVTKSRYNRHLRAKSFIKLNP